MIPILDHAQQALGRLAEEYRGKPLIEGLFNAVSVEVQELEDAIYQLSTERYLDDAVGVQLDALGVILAEERGAFTDDPYRVVLKAKRLVNKSSGTTEELIAIFKLLEPTATITVTTWPPACVTVEIDVPITAAKEVLYRRFLRKARMAGVGGQLLWRESADANVFTCATTTKTTEATSAIEFTGWNLMSPASGPVARKWHGGAYDPTRNECLFFGGRNATGVDLSDCWAWKNGSWTAKNAFPISRSVLITAWDSYNHFVLALAGDDSGTTYGFDGTSWATMAGGVGGATMTLGAFDSDRNVLVVLGRGSNPHVYELDVTTWTWSDVGTCGIETQWGAGLLGGAAAYDPIRKQCVFMVRNVTENAVTTTTLSVSGGVHTWTPQAVTQPTMSADVRFNMWWDGSLGMVCLAFMGTGGTKAKETWGWDGSAWTRLCYATPSGGMLNAGAVAFDSTRSVAVAFGGESAILGAVSNDVWEAKPTVGDSALTVVDAGLFPSSGTLVINPGDTDEGIIAFISKDVTHLNLASGLHHAYASGAMVKLADDAARGFDVGRLAGVGQ